VYATNRAVEGERGRIDDGLVHAKRVLYGDTLKRVEKQAHAAFPVRMMCAPDTWPSSSNTCSI
jgi:hypothetical protein